MTTTETTEATATSIRIEITDTPSHSKGWMAIDDGRSEGHSVKAREIPATTPSITLYGKVSRKTRTESIRLALGLVAAPGVISECTYDFSSSNRFRFVVSGARVTRPAGNTDVEIRTTEPVAAA